MTEPQSIAFDDFAIDLGNARLQRGSEAVPLTPRAFDVLSYLAANANRLITKDELHQAVWNDRIVGDGSLKECIREIRRALGDDARSPRYVQTVHRRGYQFLLANSRRNPAPSVLHERVDPRPSQIVGR